MKISLLLEAINRWNGPVNSATSATTRLTASINTVVAGTAKVTRATTGATAGVKAISSAVTRATRPLSELGAKGTNAASGVAKIAGAAERSTKTLITIGTGSLKAAEDLGALQAAATATSAEMAALGLRAGTATAYEQRFNAATREAVRDTERLGVTASSSVGGIARLGAALRGIVGSAAGAAGAIAGVQGRLTTLIGPAGMGRASRSIGFFKSQLGGLASAFSFLKYASAFAVIGIGEEFVRGVFHAGGEVERMMVTLTRLEGSATKAKAAMAWMQEFSLGAGASMSMEDIMRSYQMAKNFGMDPQHGNLASMADLAAGERVPLKQVLYAVKDAMEGTSTRPLANLGIKMKQGKKPGEANTYLYSTGEGKWVTEHSAKNPEAVLHELIKIINSKYSGLATQQAQTVPGGIEQIKKLITIFEMKVAENGVMDWALKRLNQFFAWVRGAMADGSLDRLAKRIADVMTSIGDKIIDFAMKTDWAKVTEDLKAFGQGLLLIGGAVSFLGQLGGGGFSGLVNLFVVSKIVGITGAIMGLVPAFVALAGSLLGVTIAAAPIEGIIAIIGLLAAGAYLVWANWGHLGEWWKGFWGSLPTWVQTGVKISLAAFSPLLNAVDTIMTVWEKLPAFFSGLWSRIVAGWQGSPIQKIWDKLPSLNAIRDWAAPRAGYPGLVGGGQQGQGGQRVPAPGGQSAPAQGGQGAGKPAGVAGLPSGNGQQDERTFKHVFVFDGKNQPDRVTTYAPDGSVVRSGMLSSH